MQIKNFQEFSVSYWDKSLTGFKNIPNFNIISEKAINIDILDNKTYTITRTVGEERYYILGLCFTERFINNLEDIESINIDFSSNLDMPDNAKVKLKPNKKLDINKSFDNKPNKNFIIHKDLKINILKSFELLNSLSEHQELRDKTRASHAAAIYSCDFELLAISEDVGRHNSLDKAIGKLLANNILEKAYILILSSRISYELVQKANIAGISIILACSRPTNIALELGKKLNLTLACFGQQNNSLYVFCGEDRFSF